MNISYIRSNRGIVKIMQLFFGVATCIIICPNWPTLFECYRDLKLVFTALICTFVFFNNIALLVLNLLNYVHVKLELLASALCAALLFISIILVVSYIFTSPQLYYNVQIVAIIFLAAQLAMFIYQVIVIYCLQTYTVAVRNGAAASGSAVPLGGSFATGLGAAIFGGGKEPVVGASEDRLVTAASPRSLRGGGGAVKASAPKPEKIQLYEAASFQHKGFLKIPKKNNFELTALLNHSEEKDEMPNDAHLKFTDNENVIYDIGSEVEQVVD